MTNICFLCGKEHHWSHCPTLQARPPTPPTPVALQEASPVSLAPTRFEQTFGRYAEGLLADFLDSDDPNKRLLAEAVLTGTPLKEVDQDVLDGVVSDIIRGPEKTPIDPPIVRPAYVRTLKEMTE